MQSGEHTHLFAVLGQMWLFIPLLALVWVYSNSVGKHLATWIAAKCSITSVFLSSVSQWYRRWVIWGIILNQELYRELPISQKWKGLLFPLSKLNADQLSMNEAESICNPVIKKSCGKIKRKAGFLQPQIVSFRWSTHISTNLVLFHIGCIATNYSHNEIITAFFFAQKKLNQHC